MILYAADRQRHASLVFHDSAHVAVKVGFEILVDERDAIFCAKDQMVMQRSMCRWHMGVRPSRDFAIQRHRSISGAIRLRRSQYRLLLSPDLRLLFWESKVGLNYTPLGDLCRPLRARFFCDAGTRGSLRSPLATIFGPLRGSCKEWSKSGLLYFEDTEKRKGH